MLRHLVLRRRASQRRAWAEHVERWLGRLSGPGARELDALARDAGWESRQARTLGVASSIYLGLPDDFALWAGRELFVSPDRCALRRAFLAMD